MRTASVRAGLRSDVRGRRPDRETIFCELILDAERERERVAALGMQNVLHHDPVRLALTDRPPAPANQAVDRILIVRFGEGELVPLPIELVAPILQPVRPRDQHLPAAGRAHLVDLVSVEELAAAH